ncbi:8076ef0c-2ceb-43c7-9f81-33d65742dccb [Thermothielavioides terrestris]|uniref:8076ef0c-2ceb-43c7-9f81-33d65742dccb n=1 Tax=Thermothielavioides terrestris TaxID=2587410 RepID=A0A446BXJ5_9PEZI|nr:8076ef0c-2ceb-43c7-9f81-33d65742dccb [Thermothielavioides terrestris]
MASADRQPQPSSYSDTEPDEPPKPSPSSLAPAASSLGHRPFPPVMGLYVNSSGVLPALTTFKLCGASAADFLYLVEVHFGYTARGPLGFGHGYYLRDGTTARDAVLAAAGDEVPLRFPFSMLHGKLVVLLPPADAGGDVVGEDLKKGPMGKVKGRGGVEDKVREVLQPATSKEHGVVFRFAVEVGVGAMRREEFEWRKGEKVKKADADEDRKAGRHFSLFCPPSAPTSAGTPSDGEILAELV